MPRSDASSHGEGHECQIKGRLACHHLCARVPLLRLRASNLECPTGPRRGCVQEPEAVLQVDLTFLTVQLFNHMVCVFYGLSYPQHVFELGTLARPRFPSRAVSEPQRHHPRCSLYAPHTALHTAWGAAPHTLHVTLRALNSSIHSTIFTPDPTLCTTYTPHSTLRHLQHSTFSKLFTRHPVSTRDLLLPPLHTHHIPHSNAPPHSSSNTRNCALPTPRRKLYLTTPRKLHTPRPRHNTGSAHTADLV